MLETPPNIASIGEEVQVQRIKVVDHTSVIGAHNRS